MQVIKKQKCIPSNLDSNATIINRINNFDNK